MRVGFCGIGKMGAAMVHRLLDTGREVAVWNRSPEKTKPLAERGAAVARSPRGVAESCEIVLTSLFDEAAVVDVYDGPDGLLGGARGGKVFVEMSTLTPTAIRALGERVRSQGAGLIDCPVSGTVGPAREGKLIGLAGGSGDDFARVRPVLDQLCRRVDHLGANGAGAAMKLAVNLPLVVYWEALGEALALCRDAGVDPELTLEIMKDSSGGNNALQTRAVKVIAAIRGGAKPEIGFDIDGMAKDVRTMLEHGRAQGLDLPLATRLLGCYEEAAAAGWGDRDGSSMAAFRLAHAGGQR
jgi:3-hydroxyisobutyrate dehydrogenase